MNIVLLNQAWLHSELESLGHNVITAGWLAGAFTIQVPWGAKASDLMREIRQHFEPDFIIYFDNSSLPTLVDLEQLDVPKVFFSVDTFHHLEWHAQFSKFFNHTFVAQKDYVDKIAEIRGDNNNLSWFPLWVTKSYDPSPQKKFDVSFRGTLDKSLHPERYSFFERVAKEVNLDFGQGEIEEAYPYSKIVLNQAVRGDVNFRNFEAMMGGALLITPHVGNGLDDLFIDKKNCVFYENGNSEDAIEKIKYYLKNEDEREKIARAGRELVLKNHTPLAVSKKLDSYLKNLAGSKSLKDCQASFIIQVFVVRALWQILRTENDETYLEPLERSLNQLRDLVSEDELGVIEPSKLETAIIIADLVCADCLDKSSYFIWLESLNKTFENFGYLDLLKASYYENPHKDSAFEHLSNVRYNLVRQILDVQ